MTTVDTAAARGKLSLLAAGFVQAAHQALRVGVAAAEHAAKSTTLFKDRSGATRGSIVSEALGTKGFVKARGATSLLEYGTRAHIIEAHGTALRFVVGGSVLYRRIVHHPGTAPRPFMHEAALLGWVALDRAVEVFVNTAIARV